MLGRLRREAVAGQRRDHQVKGVVRSAAVCGWIGQGLDDLQLLDDRAGPSVRDDQGQGILVLGADMNEMDVEPVDLRDEVRQRVQLRLAFAPVVVRRPVACRVLHQLQRHTLRVVAHCLSLGPPCRTYAPAHVVERLLRKTDAERTNSRVCSQVCSRAYCHGAPISDEPCRKLCDLSARWLRDVRHASTAKKPAGAPTSATILGQPRVGTPRKSNPSQLRGAGPIPASREKATHVAETSTSSVSSAASLIHVVDDARPLRENC